MPTYTYECGQCGHRFDVFHAMSASPKISCEVCEKRCKRMLGTGAGIIFKGSGFYETDFKEKKGKPPKEATAEKKSDKTSEKKTEGKPKSDGASKSSSGDNKSTGGKKSTAAA